ncbi:zinc ribbon domain-containing protein [Acidobacteria bacterium AB60]|nr:zinc ribbon domain-containing protein [Acidobacteria bacterium AB60]
MYCSACGHALVPNQPVCPQCGRPVAVAPVVTAPGFGFELSSYAGKLRALAVVWYIYGGLTLALGLIGMAFVDSFLHGRFHYWTHGPLPPMWIGPIIHFAWLFTLVRAGLALAAGYGLMHREPWGRVVAIVSAFFNILKIPIGTGLAIWTLVTLMGYRNTTLYDHVAEG